MEVERFVDTWLNAPDGALHATLIIDTKRRRHPKSSLDLMPLVKLCRKNPKFTFFVNSIVETLPNTPPGLSRRDDFRDIEDAMVKIVLYSSLVCFHVKPELEWEWCVRPNPYDEDIYDCSRIKLWDLKCWVDEFSRTSPQILAVYDWDGE